MLNIGLLGAGAMAWKHAAALTGIEGVRLAAVGGGRPQTTNHLAETYAATPYATIEQLIQDPLVDIVDICLPTFLHESCVGQAAAAGKHIICEKPLALSRSAAQNMAAAVRSAGIHFMVAQVVRFWPEYRVIKQLLDEGDLGRPLTAYAARLHDNNQADWMKGPDQGGGAALDLHIHDLDFLFSLFGRPRTLYAAGVQTDTGVWDHVYTTLDYGGVQAVAEASYLLPRAFPFSTVFRLIGTEAALIYRSGLPTRTASATAELILYRPDHAPDFLACPAVDPYEAELRYFVEAVRQDRDPAIATIDEALEVLDIALAVQASLAGQNVINFTPDPKRKEFST